MTREPWFDVAFGELYPLVYAHRSAEAAEREVAFLAERFPWPPGSCVLDLACGAGRHLTSLAARGARAFGVDRSRALLGEAAAGGHGGRLVRGDMRRLPFGDAAFHAVFSFFTSFGYFESDADDVAVLAEVARVLEPGGTCVLDYLRAEQVRAGLVAESEREARGHRVVERRRIEEGRVKKEVRVLDAEGCTVGSYEESVRLYGREELARLLGRAGLRERAVLGGFEDAPFEQGSRLVFVAERAR